MEFKKQYLLVGFVVLACAIMGYVDAILQPGYGIKSVIKIIIFVSLPFLYSFVDKDYTITNSLVVKLSRVKIAVVIGIGIYVVIVGAYLLFKGVFDFSALTTSLNQSTGVNASNFMSVALYISVVNSFLEEFFFRGFAFLTLRRLTSRRFAYGFSSLMFALYHIAMMIGWYDFIVVSICLIGLMIGGCIFNYFDESDESIYLSWLIHMFANLATNTIGCMLFYLG